MAKKVGWGLIGLGAIAQGQHLPAIKKSENSELIAVCSRSQEKAEEWAEKFGAKKAYSDYSKMVKDQEIDVIDITTPNYFHAEQTILAAEQGKHVFCEKPMANTVKDCEEMVAACKRNNVKLMVGYMLRFKTHHIRIKEMIDDGVFGIPFFGRTQFHFWLPDEADTYLKDLKISGGGALMDVGAHCIDTLRWLLGEVTEVTAYTDTIIHKYPTDSISLLLLKMENSRYGFADSSFCTSYTEKPQKLEIYGTKGSVFAATVGSQYGGRVETFTVDGWKKHEFTGENPYLKEITHFSDCIIHDKRPIVDGVEGLKTQKVAEAAYESFKKRKNMKIS